MTKGLLVILLALTAFGVPSVMAEGPTDSRTIQASGSEHRSERVVIARVWQGRTRTEKADEYYAYLVEAGVKKIEAIAGNLGVEVLRRTEGDVTEFTVISYWESRDAIRTFAGDDIEKPHHLPRDPEYLLELPTKVLHYEVRLADLGRIGAAVGQQ